MTHSRHEEFPAGQIISELSSNVIMRHQEKVIGLPRPRTSATGTWAIAAVDVDERKARRRGLKWLTARANGFWLPPHTTAESFLSIDAQRRPRAQFCAPPTSVVHRPSYGFRYGGSRKVEP